MAARRNICVIGAGVIGLSTAVNVLESFSNVSVTVIADRFTPYTTSDGAAGLWEPYLLGGTPLNLQKRWGIDTYKHLWSMAMTPDGPKAGIFILSGYTLFHKEVEDPFWADFATGFRHMTKPELQLFPKHRYGWYHTSVIAEGRFYLPWLTNRFEARGGMIKQGKVTSLNEVADDYDVIINCVGLGARQLANDTTVAPIRGQILKVHSPWVKHFVFAHEDDVYVIPCSDYTVLGGTHDAGDWETIASDKARDFIFKGCSELLPGMKHGQVMGDWVGLRPGRPSIRLEIEEIKRTEKKPIKVVHNYGHGGAGITLHWGCARHATDLVRECLADINTITAAKL